MSKRWLTAHWPHPIKGEFDIPWHVYLQKAAVAAEVEPGDFVLFYETANVAKAPASARRVLAVHEMDTGRRVAADVRYGLGGQTRYVATVAERVQQRPAGELTYVYPGHAYAPAAWGWRVPCVEHRRMPHVELKELKSRLGVGGNPNTWHGLLEVKDVAAFDALVAEHTAS